MEKGRKKCRTIGIGSFATGCTGTFSGFILTRASGNRWTFGFGFGLGCSIYVTKQNAVLPSHSLPPVLPCLIGSVVHSGLLCMAWSPPGNLRGSVTRSARLFDSVEGYFCAADSTVLQVRLISPVEGCWSIGVGMRCTLWIVMYAVGFSSNRLKRGKTHSRFGPNVDLICSFKSARFVCFV